jgi:hypothetical protein
MPVPYSFKNASGTIPLSQLDDNFAVTALSADLAAPAGASSIGIVPTPTIASTTVADAINELDTEKATVASVALKANSADLAATTGASLVGFQQTGTGSVARTVDAKSKESVSILDFGAVGDGTTDNTTAIQNAIDYIYSLGGGFVEVPKGTFIVSLSSSTEQFWYASDTVKAVANVSTCLILRSGVTLIGKGITNSIIKALDRIPSVICMLTMDGGGVRNLSVCNTWDVGLSGYGHGIFGGIYEIDDYNQNIVIDNVEVYNVGSYGIGMQYGNYVNNKYNNIHIYNTGADAFDHKVRGSSTTPISRGVSFSNIFVEKFGQRAGILESAGMDVRGPATIVNYVARNFGVASTINVGIRFSASTRGAIALETREGSSFSSLSNFNILSDSTYETAGITLLSSSYTKISNGSIKNCTDVGLRVQSASSGYFNSLGSSIENVTVYGSRIGTSFFSQSSTILISFVNCSSISEITEFKSSAYNLTAGQTEFIIDIDPAVAIVLKNDIVLTLTTDYTITSTLLTLTSGVLVTDDIKVVYPTVIGFNIQGVRNQVLGCSTYYNTTPLNIAGTAADSLIAMSNSFQFNGIRTAEYLATPILEPYGDSANIDIKVMGKGTGGFEARANGGRALRAENASASAVNWVGVFGGAANSLVGVSSAGSDTNIDFAINPKGTGSLRFGTLTTNADAPITGYITIKDSAGNLRKLAVIA